MNLLKALLCAFILAEFPVAAKTQNISLQAFPKMAPDVPVLNFNTILKNGDNVPTMFVPKIYDYPVAGTPHRKYVYFSIFNSGEGDDGLFSPAVSKTPNPADSNIYFPVDGSQPTTEEAIKYSLANIDNTEDSPITEWYMKMFGVIPINPVRQKVFIHAGWTNPVLGANRIAIVKIHFRDFPRTLCARLKRLGVLAFGGLNLKLELYNQPLGVLSDDTFGQFTIREVRKIIDILKAPDVSQALSNFPETRNIFNTTINQLLDLKSMLQSSAAPDVTVQQFFANKLPAIFRRDFSKIAASSVGRVLLYRLLIEINRLKPENNFGDVAEDAHGLNDRSRSYNRSVIFHCGVPSFCPGHAIPHVHRFIACSIFFKNIHPKLCVIGENLGNEDIIRQYETESDISLFHEMVHWYHYLRAPDRCSKFLLNFEPSIYRNSFLWLTYWNALPTEGRRLYSESQWKSIYSNFALEEILTILGSPHHNKNVFCQPSSKPFMQALATHLDGDDLCENLYRICTGRPLRFGYGFIPFTESSSVIKNVIDSTKENIAPFRRLLGNYRFID